MEVDCFFDHKTVNILLFTGNPLIKHGPIFGGKPTSIETLTGQVANVSSQATESDKAIIRMETKIEYIIKGIDEIKAEVKGRK